MPQVTLQVNGRDLRVEVESRTLLVELLREKLGLTGTHVGCDTSQCGACTVLIDGRSVKSCSTLAVEASGAEVTTIEGVGNGALHPMQEAFKEHHGLQCGFCTPGMVMSALDLASRSPDPDEDTVREWLEGNLCRCTGYHNIVRAVQAGARAMGAARAARSHEGAPGAAGALDVDASRAASPSNSPAASSASAD